MTAQEIKLNEIYVCLPNSSLDRTKLSRGSGFRSNKIFKTKSKLTHEDSSDILWPDTGGCGMYPHECREATDIEKYWYNKGITHINDIPVETNYQIF